MKSPNRVAESSRLPHKRIAKSSGGLLRCRPYQMHGRTSNTVLEKRVPNSKAYNLRWHLQGKGPFFYFAA